MQDRPWITRAVVGIVLATLFSDFSHEMVTAVLPFYLLTLGLGPSALGMIEGIADLLVSLAKLGGGGMGLLTLPVLLYAMHNVVSAPRSLSDRLSKVRVLIVGYALGGARRTRCSPSASPAAAACWASSGSWS